MVLHPVTPTDFDTVTIRGARFFYTLFMPYTHSTATPNSKPWATPSRHTRAHLPLWRRYPQANRRIAWAGAALLLLWLVGWALVPMTKGYVENSASQALGRQVTIGSIDFKPWTLELIVHDIAVAGAGVLDDSAQKNKPQPPLLTISRFYVDAELQSLLRFAPVVDALEIDKPHLRLTHWGNGQYDAQDVIERLMAQPDNKSSAPPRLALYNLALHDGAIDIIDSDVNTSHSVKAINLSLPFLSTLSTHRKIKLQPSLAMNINGVHFQSQADATPFSEEGTGQVHWRWSGVDLDPYLAYWPANLPVHLKQATVDMDMTLSFEQHPRTALTLRGMVQAHRVRLSDRQGQALLGYERLRVDIADVRPLERKVHFSRIALTQPVIHISRDAHNTINWHTLGTASATTPSNTPATARSKIASPSPWQLAIDQIAIEQGQVQWHDAITQPATVLQAQAIDLNLNNVGWPMQQSAQLQGTMHVPGGTLAMQGVVNPQGLQRVPPAAPSPTTPPTDPVSSSATAPTTVAITDTPPKNLPPSPLTAQPIGHQQGLPLGNAQVNLQLQGLDLKAMAPYIATYLRPQLTGLVHADISVQWQPPPTQSDTPSTKPTKHPTEPTGLVIQAHKLSLADWSLSKGKARLARWHDFTFTDVAIAPDDRTLRIGSIQLQQPETIITRNKQGLWMFDDWLQPAAQPASTSATESVSPAAALNQPLAKPQNQPQTPWQVQLDQWSVQQGSLVYEDAAMTRPVRFALFDLQMQTGAVTWPWPVSTTQKAASSDFMVTARIADSIGAAAAHHSQKKAPIDATGSLQYQGTFGLAPLNVKGTMQAKRLPVHSLDGYLADFLSIEMLRAYASYEGDIAWSQPAPNPHSTASGAAQASANPLLSIAGNARLDDLRVLSTAIATDDVATPAGEELLAWKSLQLQGLNVQLTPEKAPAISIAQTSLSDFFARITLAANGQLNLGQILKKPTATNTDTPTDQSSDTAVARVTTPKPLAPAIKLGPTSLINGRVLFTDNFIKPNYSADLSDLTGQLSAFASQPTQGPPQLADLSLRGTAEGSADLEITGQLNPLAQPLVLNIQGKMHNLDLPPLSPYAIKYAGHGIQRGKLNVDMQYQVAPDGKLSANNRIVLNQLQFGDAVEGAPNSLPVRLAVALLADSKGVIDLDLPVSGSINDPDFSVGPIIFKAIINIIGKALISPFSLLSKAIGGDADLSRIPFAPGSSTLDTQAQAHLQKIATALLARPTLQVTITGMAYLAQEREGIQREQLEQRLLLEKRRQKPDTGPAAPLEITASERAQLLQSLYKKTDMPKPKNTLGFTKDLPVADIEKLLLANITPTPRMAIDLARQRAAAIQHFLLTQKLPASRVMVAAPTSLTQVPNNTEKWEPQAELNLTMH